MEKYRFLSKKERKKKLRDIASAYNCLYNCPSICAVLLCNNRRGRSHLLDIY